jgi:hypothetical protein
MAAVTTLALVVSGAFVMRAGWLRDASAKEQLRIETVSAIEDKGLTELTTGEGSLWALDHSQGIVFEVKPATNELGRVVATDPNSEELVVSDGRVWTVGRREGFVSTTPLSGAPDDLRRFTVVPVTQGQKLVEGLELHAAADKVWVAAGVERPAVALDSRSVSGYPPATAGGSLTNLSTIGGSSGEVWGMTLDGRVARLSQAGDVAWDRRIPDDQDVEQVIVDGDSVWLRAEETLMRVDAASGAIREIDFSARDMALGDGLLWAIGKDEVGVFDSVSTRAVAAIDIDAELLDVEYLADSAWALGTQGKIFRLSMNDRPLQLTQPLQDDRIVYAYSSDGDLWVEQADGDDVNLIASSNEDRRPSLSPDGKTIAFQRGKAISGGVYFLDLSDGEERFLGHGGWPTYGHEAGFAYVSRGRGVYGINFVNGRETTFVATVENPANLSWSAGDDALHYVAGSPDRRLPYRITFASDGTPGTPQLLEPTDTPTGADYPVAAAGADDRLYVIRSCCRLPRAELINEFGYIDLSDPKRPFVPLIELTETGLDEPITLTGIDRVPPALGDPQRWTEAEEGAWLVSDGYRLIYLYRDAGAWTFADQRLEHPGRAYFDGFSRLLER